MANIPEEALLALAVKNKGGSGGTNNYNDLSNQPQINGNTLTGNKSASDLGLVAAETGKGLSSNNYTDEDKAIVGGVTAALAGKQGVLTAGKYIDIDANNEISVEREIPNEAFTYTIQQIGDGIVKITKTVNGAVVFEKTYSGDVDVTLDALRYVYSSGVQSYTLLIASDTHEAGFKQVMSWWQRETYTENFSTVDHSGEKLIIKSEMDTALAGKQNTLTFDDTPTDNSNNPVKSNGIYDALALKQNATDNSLDTTAKTIVGAINEHEGDIDSLKSGLTNLKTVYTTASTGTYRDKLNSMYNSVNNMSVRDNYYSTILFDDDVYRFTNKVGSVYTYTVSYFFNSKFYIRSIGIDSQYSWFNSVAIDNNGNTTSTDTQTENGKVFTLYV